MEKRLKVVEELKRELNKKLNEKLDKLEMLEKTLPPGMPASAEIIETSEDIERIKFAIKLLEESIDEIDDGFESAKRYAIHVLSHERNEDLLDILDNIDEYFDFE